MLSLTGLIVGWEIHADLLHTVAGYALLIAFAFVVLGIGVLVEVSGRSPGPVTGIAFLIVLPLTFLASTFVPIAGLSDGMQHLAEYNPVSSLAPATRVLFGNPTALPADAPWRFRAKTPG